MPGAYSGLARHAALGSAVETTTRTTGANERGQPRRDKRALMLHNHDAEVVEQRDEE
ncbi:MAG: hypothetical protein ACHQ4H_08105 [Ktedonobacterales bacterium]